MHDKLIKRFHLSIGIMLMLSLTYSVIMINIGFTTGYFTHWYTDMIAGGVIGDAAWLIAKRLIP